MQLPVSHDEELYMYFLTRKSLSRRTLLRSSGVALALPLLESMIPAGAHGAELPKPRLACLYMAHGAIMGEWTPQQDGRNFELSPTLQSLAAAPPIRILCLRHWCLRPLLSASP